MHYHGDINSLKGISGIYKILCLATGRFYIGSSYDLRKRYRNHLYALKKNKHSNPILSSAWSKYGQDSFEFVLLERCSTDDLLIKEQHYIDSLQPFGDRGFNINPKADSCLGAKRRPSAANKKKMTLYSRLPDRKLLSPDGILFTFRQCAEFARLHSISKVGLSKVLVGGIAYTSGGWRLPNTPKPEYKIVRPEGDIVTIPHMGLVRFCKENKLNYGHINEILLGKRKTYRGWCSVDAIDTFVTLTGPDGQEAKVCSLSKAWFWKKYGLHQANFSGLLRGRVKSCQGWRLKSSMEVLQNVD